MPIYLDSAMPDEAQQAMGLGFVTGITTNPALLARTGRQASEVIPELCDICPGTVFYQLTSATVSERRAEGERMLALRPGQIGLKIPASTENMALVHHFSARGTVAVTALFNSAQAHLACEAGAHYLLPYVNRTSRLRGDGPGFVQELVQVCEAVGRGTQVLAASIKSPEEATRTLLAGAKILSIPLGTLLAMGDDPLSEQAVADFARAASAT
jgi:transaldolase